MVVPYPPGGSIDILGRIVAHKLGESLGQNVVVENRPGAAGTIGSALVAKAPADGYTILMTASVHVISPYILKNVGYDPIADFTPVTEIAAGPLIAVAGLQVPATNVSELLTQAKQTPEKYIFATSGYGAAGHLAVELLRRMVGGQTLLVPYNGSAPALTRMMAGDVHIMFDPMLSAYPFVKRGQLKALAVTSRERLAMAPEIPTVVELGIPELEFYSWYGIWGPRGTPVEVVNRLYADVAQIIKQPDVDKRLKDSGFVPRGTSPDEFTRYIGTEKDRYVRIIKEASIKTQ
jgi:tripartite-type tricarboxylate transporter receptor subunit TctC